MNNIIVTNSYNKKKLLMERKKLSSDKIMSKSEFFNKFFATSNEMIYYIMKKYNVIYDVAKMYIDNLIYASQYNSKTEFLLNLKNDLIDEKLFKEDELWINNLKSSNITFVDLYLSNFEKTECTEFNYKIDNPNNNYNHNIYIFNNIEEEITYVACKIIELLNMGININKIKLLHLQEDYKQTLKRIFNFYNLPLEKEYSLYSYNTTLKFLKKLKESKNILDSLKEIEQDELYNEIVSILNKYTFISEIDDIYIECLEYDFKNKFIKEKLKNKIELVDFDDSLSDEYVFLLGFNDNLPRTYKDEDFLNDDIKSKLMIDTSIDKNNTEKIKELNRIKNVCNLTITYCKKVKNQEVNISPLNEILNYEIIRDEYVNYSYSILYNKIILTKYLDKLNKLNIREKDLPLLLYNYDIPYKKYNNKYNKINSKNLYKFLNNKLLLSYSSMDNYYKCKFKYYLNNILKISKYEETFAIKIGKIFHEILSLAFKEDFNFDICWENTLKKYEFDSKEKVFIKKLKENLEFIIETINKQNKLTKLNNEMYEKEIFIDKSKNIKITFMGIIDKLKYKEVNGENLVTIIDYKTGIQNISLNNNYYGLDLQLPTYLYLSMHLKELKNVQIVGFYLQKILNNEINYNYKKDYLKEKENQLKLEGYSIDNYELLEMFDSSFQNSEMIKGMKTSSKGFYSYAKVLNKNEIDNLIKLVDNKIDDAIDSILDADFDINPKILKNEKTCNFCPFKEICYVKEEDYVELEEIKDLDFLKG